MKIQDRVFERDIDRWLNEGGRDVEDAAPSLHQQGRRPEPQKPRGGDPGRVRTHVDPTMAGFNRAV
jgi:hypothetical protein